MRFGVIGSLADSRVCLFHYLPLVVTRDAEHPARWGRSKVMGLAVASSQRAEGVALVCGPTADAVAPYVALEKLPDPCVVILVAEAVDPSHALLMTVQAMQQRGQSVSLHVVSPKTVLLCDRSTGSFACKDKASAPKDASYKGPAVKPMGGEAPKPVKAPKKAKAPIEETPPSAPSSDS
jgi:hypothetical protein